MKFGYVPPMLFDEVIIVKLTVNYVSSLLFGDYRKHGLQLVKQQISLYGKNVKTVTVVREDYNDRITYTKEEFLKL